MLALPWGIVTFTLTVVVWSVSMGMATFPISQAFVPEDADGGPYHFGNDYVLHGWGTVRRTAPACACSGCCC